MARLRYVKSPEQLKQAAEANPEFLKSTVSSLRCVYETDAALARAVVPEPLEAAEKPEVCLTVSNVAIHVNDDLTIEIGSAIFGVRASYDGVPGIYLVTMPMTTETAVVGGRETYGEPKKIADISFTREGDEVSGTVTRMGIPYIEVKARIGESLGPRTFDEFAYCFKALPACEKGGTFDGDPLLVRLEWKHDQQQVHRAEGEIILRDSPFDPVADLPVRRIVQMEYEVGSTRSNGTVLRSVPGAWLMPFLVQRYDDPMHPGVEVAV
jgi:acetoacetate decarboxylase